MLGFDSPLVLGSSVCLHKRERTDLERRTQQSDITPARSVSLSPELAARRPTLVSHVPSGASLDSDQHFEPGTNTTPIQEHPPGQLHPRRRGGSGGGGALTSVAYSSSSDGELVQLNQQQQQQLLQETPGVLATTAGAPTYLPAAALGLGLHQHPLVAHGGPPGGCCAVTTSHNIGECYDKTVLRDAFKITCGLPKRQVLL